MMQELVVPKVSVIMPVYNPGDYLVTSMESVLGQTFSDLEVVCVNDGSTDDSLTLMRAYAATDRRVRIVDKPNGGYGHAMNRGLDAARGTYVMILEPDDFMSADMVERLVGVAEEWRCDVVKSNYYEHEGETGSDRLAKPVAGKPTGVVVNVRELPTLVVMQPCIWSAIYRRELLVRNNIRFVETPGASYQDTSFQFKVLSVADRVMLLPEGYLHYRIDNEASSVKSSGKVFNVCDEFAAMEAWISTDAELRALLMPPLQRLKFATYYWNLGRLTDEYAELFEDYLALSMIKARYDGFLDQRLFSKQQWRQLTEVIDGYERRRAAPTMAATTS